MKPTTEEKRLLKELDKLGADYIKLERKYKALKKENEALKKLCPNDFTAPSVCKHKGCTNRSTCGDYCYTHCNCRKN